MASCVYDKTGRQWEALRARGQASVALENLQMGTGQKDRDRYVQSPLLGAVRGKMPEKESGETQGSKSEGVGRVTQGRRKRSLKDVFLQQGLYGDLLRSREKAPELVP